MCPRGDFKFPQIHCLHFLLRLDTLVARVGARMKMDGGAAALSGAMGQGLQAIDTLPAEAKLLVLVLCFAMIIVFLASMSLGRWVNALRNPGKKIEGLLRLTKNNEGRVRIHKDNLISSGVSKGDQIIVTVTAPTGEQGVVRGILAPFEKGKTTELLSLPESEYVKFISEEFFTSEQLQNIQNNPQFAANVSVSVKPVRSGIFEQFWNHPDLAQQVSFRTAFWLTLIGCAFSVAWTYLYDCYLGSQCTWPFN